MHGVFPRRVVGLGKHSDDLFVEPARKLARRCRSKPIIFDQFLGRLASALGALASMASSLCYTEIASTINVDVTGDGNVVTVPASSELEASFEKYDETDILSPLKSARSRILDHIKKLRNNSVTNLSWESV